MKRNYRLILKYLDWIFGIFGDRTRIILGDYLNLTVTISMQTVFYSKSKDMYNLSTWSQNS